MITGHGRTTPGQVGARAGESAFSFGNSSGQLSRTTFPDNLSAGSSTTARGIEDRAENIGQFRADNLSGRLSGPDRTDNPPSLEGVSRPLSGRRTREL